MYGIEGAGYQGWEVVADGRFSFDQPGTLVTVKELLASQGQRGAGPKGEPKYRNPDNPEQTWTGKGMRPGWFVAAQERGITREDMRI